MAKIKWDAEGQRTYETGVDHGVLYLTPETGNAKAYSQAYAWNGLTAVNEAPSGAEPTPLYADNIKYLNLVSAEEFGATVEAFTYPPEFAICDGSYVLGDGIAFGQQSRKSFGMSYRTKIGNDVKRQDYGYKLHFIYGATAAPSEKAYATINDTPEAITFSWTLSTTPVSIESDNDLNLTPTATITIDSTQMPKAFMDSIESILYGNDTESGRLPLPGEIVELYNASNSGSGTAPETDPETP